MPTMKVNGITFATQADHTLKQLRPVGTVEFVPEPTNAYDAGAISVRYEGRHIGYVPKGDWQGHLKAEGITHAVIEEYLYHTDDPKYATSNGFNSDHVGEFKALKLKIGENLEQAPGGRRPGTNYFRISSFVHMFDSYAGGDGLIKWGLEEIRKLLVVLSSASATDIMKLVLKEGYLYELYKKVGDQNMDNGTAMHGAIESIIRLSQDPEADTSNPSFTLTRKELNRPDDWMAPDEDHVIIACEDYLPEGWDHFIETYEIDPVNMEHRLYDNDLQISGQYDLLAYVRLRKKPDDPMLLTILDWKSSKKVRQAQKIQVAFYAKNAQFEDEPVQQGMVVAWGAETQKGYSIGTIDRARIDSFYIGLTHLRQTAELLGESYAFKYLEN